MVAALPRDIRAPDLRIVEAAVAASSAGPVGAVVMRAGRVTAEAYAGGFGPDAVFEIGSIRKSVFAALVGRAVETHALDLHMNAAAAWPDLLALGDPDKDRGITLHHLLSGTSGWLTPDPPGVRFLYNNAAFTAAERVFAAALDVPGGDLAPLVDRQIRAAVGAQSWVVRHWDRPFDPARHATPGPKLAVYGCLVDLARWALAWQGLGRFGATRIFPEQFARMAAAPTNPHVADAPYGYCLYVNADGRTWPGTPADAFGHGGLGSFADGRRSRAAIWMCRSLDLSVALVAADGIGLGEAPASDAEAKRLRTLLRALVEEGGL